MNMSRHDWMGKVNSSELCKKFKFDHIIKRDMLKPKPILKNETRNFFFDFEIQTNHLTSGSLGENQGKQKETQVHRPCQKTTKSVENEGDGNADCIWRVLNSP